jgi:hypothetical protein
LRFEGHGLAKLLKDKAPAAKTPIQTEILRDHIAEIPWTTHLILLNKVSDAAATPLRLRVAVDKLQVFRRLISMPRLPKQSMRDGPPPPRMPPETYAKCLNAVRGYLAKNPSIRNRQIRELTGINYDQAIAFFNLAVLERKLRREGQSSGTHYVLP